MNTEEEKFILKEDGIYWIENCPEEPEWTQQYGGLWKKRLQFAIDNAIEVSNQTQVKDHINPFGAIGEIEPGKIYSLECSVEKKETPDNRDGKMVALVTFPQSKEDNPIRTKEEILDKAAEDYANKQFPGGAFSSSERGYHWARCYEHYRNGFESGAKWMESQFSSSYRSGEESKWVSVKERLPDLSNARAYSDGKTYDHPKAVKVLAFSPSTISQTTAYYWGTNVDDPLKGWSLMGVTHWQHLPEPPKNP